MIDASKMNDTQRVNYIFDDETGPIGKRFSWLKSALMGDVQTFENTVQSGNQSLIVGGGNLSVPILICTGLELASALYVGDTSYIKKVPKYDATTNVEQFINEFFTGRARQMPLLIWDGVRNGIDHLFFPKPLQYSNYIIMFTFYRGGESQVTITNNIIEMRIEISELFQVFRKAIEQYETKLKSEADLQVKFITAWDSFESYIRNIDPSEKQKFGEAGYLIGELVRANTVKLF